MSLFSKQPGFCCVCGKAGEYTPHYKFGFICEDTMKCMEEYGWRHTLHVMGKKYYQKPEKKENE
jgi:hypothetical protein